MAGAAQRQRDRGTVRLTVATIVLSFPTMVVAVLYGPLGWCIGAGLTAALVAYVRRAERAGARAAVAVPVGVGIAVVLCVVLVLVLVSGSTGGASSGSGSGG